MQVVAVPILAGLFLQKLMGNNNNLMRKNINGGGDSDDELDGENGKPRAPNPVINDWLETHDVEKERDKQERYKKLVEKYKKTLRFITGCNTGADTIPIICAKYIKTPFEGYVVDWEGEYDLMGAKIESPAL